jgi:anti-sigma factor RsiW
VNCSKLRDNLVAYLHGELDKETVMGIHHHLSACEVCVQEEIELRQTNRLLDQFQFEALPEDFDETLHRKIQQTQPAPRKIKSDFRQIVYAIAATILIMLGIQFIGSRIFQSTQQTIHFKDFPTTQAVFKSETSRSLSESTLKEQFMQRYLQSGKSGKMKIER